MRHKHKYQHELECLAVARMGDDELVYIISGLSSKESSTLIAERLLRCISEVVPIGHIKLRITGSIGLAFYQQGDTIDTDELLRPAGQAMYRAKAAGKNRCQWFTQVYDDEMAQET